MAPSLPSNSCLASLTSAPTPPASACSSSARASARRAPAKVYMISGALDEAAIDATWHYVVNPVEARIASLDLPGDAVHGDP